MCHPLGEHGPDIFDRTANSLTYLNTSKVGYFDNLVLADRFLGEIKSAMKKAGLWETTTVLITSDHEWRHVRLYDGKRLRKLPYLLKMPNQQNELIFEGKFSPMLVTKELILKLLAGKLPNEHAVIRWLESQKLPAV